LQALNCIGAADGVTRASEQHPRATEVLAPRSVGKTVDNLCKLASISQLVFGFERKEPPCTELRPAQPSILSRTRGVCVPRTTARRPLEFGSMAELETLPSMRRLFRTLAREYEKMAANVDLKRRDESIGGGA
jgi:hypothetical protein